MSASLWHKSTVHSALEMLSTRALTPGARQSDLFLRRRMALAEDLHWKDIVGHYGCVNAIEFSHGEGHYIASGGDDRRVLLWDVEKALSDVGKPSAMKGEHNSNIFCIAFDMHNKTAYSGGNDEQVIVHDLTTGETKDVFTHDDAVYGLSADPTNPHVFASACDDGRVLMFDTRDTCADPFCLANYTSSMHSVMYNPVEPRLLATANAKEGVGLWDVRKPRSCVLRYGGSFVQQSCMSVCFNHHGDRLVALRRRLPPVLYKIHDIQPVCEFDHSGYYNSCTMKSVCFAGDDDQYVVSGSDEFSLYMWAVPEDLSERAYINSAHMVLKGHRSIVNQVRFNAPNHLLISSGVEKIIKVWSPFKLPTKVKSKVNQSSRERHVYSHEEYINLVLQDGNVMSHDYSQESTDEDPRMMAFFDSLVQRELEGWSSDDSLSSNEEALYSRIAQLSQSDIDSDDSFVQAVGSGGTNENDPSFSPFTIAFASVMASQAAEGNDRYPRLSNALENAERASRVGNTEPASDSQTEPTETNSSDAHRRDISSLVKKKKKEIKESIQRHLKKKLYEPSLSSVSSCSSDVSDESDSSSETLDTGEGKCKQVEVCVKPEKVSQLEKQAKIRLKKLKTLRDRILNSDTDDSDKESQNILGITKKDLTDPVSHNHDEPCCSKVAFKGFQKRTCKINTEESKEYLKSQASPDFGPYLQKTVIASSSVETRRSSCEEKETKQSKTLPHDKSKVKGRHKIIHFSEKNDSDSLPDEGHRCTSFVHSENISKQKRLYSSVSSDHSKDKINVPIEQSNGQTGGRLNSAGNGHGHLGQSCKKSESEISVQRNAGNNAKAFKDNADLVNSSSDTNSDTDTRGRWNGSSRSQRATSVDVREITRESLTGDGQAPSCSYTVIRDKPTSSDHTLDSMETLHQCTSTPDSQGRKRKGSSSEEDNQPTWTEFKRFKNKFKRAQRQYRERKVRKHSEEHRSDDD